MTFILLNNTAINLDDVAFVDTNEGSETHTTVTAGKETDYTNIFTITSRGGITRQFTVTSSTYEQDNSSFWRDLFSKFGIS